MYSIYALFNLFFKSTSMSLCDNKMFIVGTRCIIRTLLPRNYFYYSIKAKIMIPCFSTSISIFWLELYLKSAEFGQH